MQALLLALLGLLGLLLLYPWRQHQRLRCLRDHDVGEQLAHHASAGGLTAAVRRDTPAAASDRQRKKFYKLMEDELRAEYEEDLKKMGMTQGRILIKLIDREIGQTSFHVVKDLRNGLTAFVFQSLAKIFGHDLKAQYDPTGEDRVIEDIVVAIERGYIKLE